MKKVKAIIAMMLFSVGAFAQSSNATEGTIWDDPILLFYVTAGFMFVVALLVIAVALYMLQVLRYMAKDAAMEQAKKSGSRVCRRARLVGKTKSEVVWICSY